MALENVDRALVAALGASLAECGSMAMALVEEAIVIEKGSSIERWKDPT